MLITEKIETINELLVTHFGREANSHRPMFRVVRADEQTEMAMCDTTEEGIAYLTPVARERKKYPWIGVRHILERLVLVPEFQQAELCGAKDSYECIWIFETQAGIELPPRFDVAKLCVDTLYAALGKKSMAKYKDPEAGLTGMDALEHKKARINKLQENMFGNETAATDALAYRTGVVVPSEKDTFK